jgi:hypothetical protein
MKSPAVGVLMLIVGVWVLVRTFRGGLAAKLVGV